MDLVTADVHVSHFHAAIEWASLSFTPPAQTMYASADVAIHAEGGKENITAKATFLR